MITIHTKYKDNDLKLLVLHYIEKNSSKSIKRAEIYNALAELLKFFCDDLENAQLKNDLEQTYIDIITEQVK